MTGFQPVHSREISPCVPLKSRHRPRHHGFAEAAEYLPLSFPCFVVRRRRGPVDERLNLTANAQGRVRSIERQGVDVVFEMGSEKESVLGDLVESQGRIKNGVSKAF